jgi:hypothetical protein
MRNVSLKLRVTSQMEFGVPPYMCMFCNDSQDMDYSRLCMLKRISVFTVLKLLYKLI